jgi:hypothetical protein
MNPMSNARSTPIVLDYGRPSPRLTATRILARAASMVATIAGFAMTLVTLTCLLICCTRSASDGFGLAFLFPIPFGLGVIAFGLADKLRDISRQRM